MQDMKMQHTGSSYVVVRVRQSAVSTGEEDCLPKVLHRSMWWFCEDRQRSIQANGKWYSMLL